MFTNPISVSFWPLHTSVFYSSTKYESIEKPTQPRAVAPQSRPRPCYKVHMFFLKYMPKGWMQVHMFTNSISVLFYSSKHESTERQRHTQPRAVAPQPSHRPCYKVHMFFLIYTPKGWTQVHMFTNPISVTFLQLPTKFYSSNHESNENDRPNHDQ
jgi:hypothetical protein